MTVGYTSRLSKAAAAVLRPGEELLAGARAMPKGAIGPPAGDEGSVAAAVPYVPRVALGMTDRRLLVFRRGGLRGSPKDLIGEIPIERIAALQEPPSERPARTEAFLLHLTDGSALAFEVLRADGADAIVSAFRAAKGRGSGATVGS